MTKEQITWAAQHDWYVEPILSNMGFYDGVRVRDVSYASNAREDVITYRVFRDFRKLRQWAGY